MVLDDSQVVTEQLADWKQVDAVDSQPDVLEIEIFLRLKDTPYGKTLVILDEDQRKWDVRDQYVTAMDAADRASNRVPRHPEIVLERWRVEVGPRPSDSADGLGLREALPNVYKKAVVLFRSLYTTARLLPAFRYQRRIAKQPPSQPYLPLNYRVYNADERQASGDLDIQLCPSDGPVSENFVFEPCNSPVGPMQISVMHRVNCDFQLVDSEALLSSKFADDDPYFRPSLEKDNAVPGSMPVQSDFRRETPDRTQAYGSLSTYHQVGPATGTSPMSTLRVAGADDDDSAEQSPQKVPPTPRTTEGSRSSLRAEGAPPNQRRTSVSFQPFKAGSLSSSPATGGHFQPSPASSLGRPSTLGALGQARNRTSLNALPQQALRTPSLPNETAIASSGSSSPKPAPISRYSSSFGHRRSRFSSGGSAKPEEDYASSGKGSLTSSNQPGSGNLPDGEGGSSGSMQTGDDDDVSDFIKLIEQNKELKSFSRKDSVARDASARKTTAALNRFHRMKDSNAALSDSMSSSLQLHRSSSSSSRQLSNVPPMVAGTSFSTSSSPGKPVSPHTPHTPAIPSRLSANSIAEYSEPRRSSRTRPRAASRHTEEILPEESSSEATTRDPIDIPTSPRAWPHARRSSSVSQRHRSLEAEPDPYGRRSTSMPVEERPDLSMSELLRAAQENTVTPLTLERAGDGAIEAEAEDAASDSRPDSREDVSTRQNVLDPTTAFRNRMRRDSNLRRGTSSGDGSSSSLAGSGGSGGQRGSRYSFSSRTAAAAVEDEEPLFFMSDINSQSRRSIEEGRGGTATGRRERGAERRLGGDW